MAKHKGRPPWPLPGCGCVLHPGTLEAGVTPVHVADKDEGHKKMEQMVESHEVDGAVTMHFPFPISVSTVGRVVTPAPARECSSPLPPAPPVPTVSRA